MATISELVLASGSTARRRMLEAAGVAFSVHPVAFDESAAKQAARARGSSAEDCAKTLAAGKALTASRQMPDALVIGADQLLEQDGRWFDKPKDLAAARAQLSALNGRGHRLVSAVALVRDGTPVWECVDSATLRMRHCSEDFLEVYLDRCGPTVLASVGSYEIEGIGAQLFEQVSGDYFTILGLPLLPLLARLRAEGMLAS
jgi:septum formation protein